MILGVEIRAIPGCIVCGHAVSSGTPLLLSPPIILSLVIGVAIQVETLGARQLYLNFPLLATSALESGTGAF